MLADLPCCVDRLQPPKDIVNKAPMQEIGPHPQTPRRYPNSFLSRLYEDDGKPAKYEYGYVPRSRRDMVDILAHHRSYSTSTRDMTEEGKLPLEPVCNGCNCIYCQYRYSGFVTAWNNIIYKTDRIDVGNVDI